MGPEEAKAAIQKLIDKYNKYKDDPHFFSNEKAACQTLIVPFVRDILHWNVDDYSEFRSEETLGSKRIDYVVCNDGVSQFIIEAKAPSKDILENAEAYKQAIEYGYGKEHQFAILTNFKEFIILGSDVKFTYAQQAELARINILNYSEKDLNLLLSFERERWLKKDYADLLLVSAHKKTKQGSRIPVDAQLLEDMKHWRESLLGNLQKQDKYDFEDEQEFMKIEEQVQKFIDRLIFICYCEDKELKESKLKHLLNDKKERFSMKAGHLLNSVRELFEDYRKVYNSDLFDKSDCDTFYFDDDKLVKVLEDLREPKGRIAYDFKSIEADILGRTYENFIGHLTTGKKRFKEQEDIGKRKKEGIYYTPKYIVDYIVKNTVSEYIKDKSFEEIKKVRILDPACGSGSFLINAFDALVDAARIKLGRLPTYEEKRDLMINCIYGVDLDERAVAIAKLNLSLKLAAKQKLPELRNNIKNGNSLIDDSAVAGYHAFKWEEEFSEIFKGGGFDVVIGNPPYVSQKGTLNKPNIAYSEREYYRKKYATLTQNDLKTRGGVKLNLFGLWIEQATQLLKNKGILGFIVHKNLLKVESYKFLRKYLLEKTSIVEIVDLGENVFEGVTGETVILTIRNEKSKNNIVNVKLNADLTKQMFNSTTVSQENFQHSTDFAFNIYETPFIALLKKKLSYNAEKLESLYQITSFGLNTKDNKKYFVKNKLNEKYQKAVMGRDIARWEIKSHGYVLYDKEVLTRTGDLNSFKAKEKLILQRIGSDLTAAYDTNSLYCYNSINMILAKDEIYSLKYLLCLLNSKLINFYYKNVFSLNSKLTVNITQGYLSQLPIHHASKEEQKKFNYLASEIIALTHELQSPSINELNKEKIKHELQKKESELNKRIYELYDISSDEQKIIEESLNG